MNSTNPLLGRKKDYSVPSSRIVEALFDRSFLQSNLEPIGGGDDPEIDW